MHSTLNSGNFLEFSKKSISLSHNSHVFSLTRTPLSLTGIFYHSISESILEHVNVFSVLSLENNVLERVFRHPLLTKRSYRYQFLLYYRWKIEAIYHNNCQWVFIEKSEYLRTHT